jgi:hypothetical protein
MAWFADQSARMLSGRRNERILDIVLGRDEVSGLRRAPFREHRIVLGKGRAL